MLGSCAGTAQTVLIDTIVATQPWWPRTVYTFPYLRMPDRPEVAARINKDLCIDFLEVDPDTADGRIFEMVWGDTARGGMPRLLSLAWSCEHVLTDIASIELSGEGCGAYCEEFTVHYVYDLRTGVRAEYDSLFTGRGLVVVNDTLGKRWRRLVNAEIALLDSSSKAASVSSEELDRITEMLELYSNCLGERSESDPYVYDIDPLEKALRVYISPCAPHVVRALDDLGSITFDLPYTWLVLYLRPEMRAVFVH
jgi:hypothetical protein